MQGLWSAHPARSCGERMPSVSCHMALVVPPPPLRRGRGLGRLLQALMSFGVFLPLFTKLFVGLTWSVLFKSPMMMYC